MPPHYYNACLCVCMCVCMHGWLAGWLAGSKSSILALSVSLYTYTPAHTLSHIVMHACMCCVSWFSILLSLLLCGFFSTHKYITISLSLSNPSRNDESCWIFKSILTYYGNEMKMKMKMGKRRWGGTASNIKYAQHPSHYWTNWKRFLLVLLWLLLLHTQFTHCSVSSHSLSPSLPCSVSCSSLCHTQCMCGCDM